MKNITSTRAGITLPNNGLFNWDTPVLQGILNVTPDSFSDGGAFDKYEEALSRAQEMTDFGATIIDVGGETTKPGATPVPLEVEKQRVLPVIEKLSSQKMLVSIDSRNSDVMREAIAAGAQIINDVSALEHDPKSIDVLNETGVPVILMHAQGNPDVMQNNPEYDNVVLDIYDYLEERINFCVRRGISKDKIIVDPGIGFGKTVDHNLEILANVAIFHGLGVPVLIGVSRKSFIGKITGEDVASKRVSGSIAAAQYSIDHGVQIVRIHDVEETSNALKVHSAIYAKNDIV